MAIIKYHTDLKVYQKSFEVAMEIYKTSKNSPILPLYNSKAFPLNFSFQQHHELSKFLPLFLELFGVKFEFLR